MKKGVMAILFIICAIFGVNFVLAVAIDEELHLNIQIINSSGDVNNGTFHFEFNISTLADCSDVVYTNFTNLTTDSRGIISYYLEDVNLNFSSQYWLCYYRDGVLINASKIARSPYSFTAKNVSAMGIANDSNMDLTGKNISVSTGFFTWLGDLVSRITSLFVQDIDFSGTINGSGWINTTANISADYFFGNVCIGSDCITDWDSLNETSLINSVNASALSINTTANIQNLINGTSDSLTLGGYLASYFMPLNTSVSGDFDFNDGWMNGGLSIIGGDIYAQTVWVYNLSSLNLNTLNINGSILPPVGFDNIFDVGNSSLRWKDIYIGGELHSNGTGDNWFLGKVGIGTSTPSNTLDVRGQGNFSGTIYINNATDISLLNQSYNITYENYVIANFSNKSNYWVTDEGILDNVVDILGSWISNDLNWINRTEADPWFNQTSMVWSVNITANLQNLLNSSYVFQGSSNQTYVSCSNITGAVSDLCTITGAGGGESIWVNYTDYTGLNISYPSFINISDTLFVNKTSGNVGIGTTSPVATLNVVGNVTFTMAIGENFTAGALFVNSTNVGIGTKIPTEELGVDGDITVSGYYYGDGSQLTNVVATTSASWNRSGTNVILHHSGDSVGIGTASPGAKLEIAQANAHPGLYINATIAAYNPHIRLYQASSAYDGEIGLNAATGHIYIGDVGTATGVLNVDLVNDRVGIGTASPAWKLQVVGNIQINSSAGATATPNYIDLGNTYSNAATRDKLKIYLYNIGTEQYGFGVGSAGDVQYHSNAYHDFYIANGHVMRIQSGKVGIGTTSPATLLQVGDDTGGKEGIIRLESGNGAQLRRWNIGVPYGNTDTSGSYYDFVIDDTQLGSTPEFLVEYGSGNVGIGTTSPAHKLTVEGHINITSTNRLYMGGGGSQYYNGSCVIVIGKTSTLNIC